MKKIQAVILCIVLCVSVTFTVAPPVLAAGSNLIANPGAEDGATGWLGSVMQTSTVSNVNSGANAFYWAGTNQNRKLTSSSVASSSVSSGKTYMVSVWVKVNILQSESTVNLKLGISSYNEAAGYSNFGITDCFIVVPIKNLNTTYQKISFAMTGEALLATSPSAFMCGVVADSLESGYNIYFDDFEFRESDEPMPNVIPNPGAEDVLNGWTSVNQPTATLSNVHSGLKAFYMAGTAVNRKINTTSLSSALVNVDKNYILSVYTKVSVTRPSSTGSIRFGISTYAASIAYTGFGFTGCYTTIAVKDITTTYQKISVYCSGAQILASNPAGLTVGIIANTAESGFNVFFDDFELREVPVGHVGTAIRTTGIQGMRVKTDISKTLIDNKIEGYCIVEYGTIAIKADYLENKELTLDGVYNWSSGAKPAAKGIAYSTDIAVNKIFNETDLKIQYTGVLTGISSTNYTTQYAVRPYVLYRSNSGNVNVQKVYYGQTVTHSVYEIAIAAFEAHGTAYTDVGGNSWAESYETRAYLYASILSVCGYGGSVPEEPAI